MLILPPFNVGDTASLYAAVEYSLVVTDPSGVARPVVRSGVRADIALTMVGTYRYEFSDGSTGELVVVDAEPSTTVIP